MKNFTPILSSLCMLCFFNISKAQQQPGTQIQNEFQNQINLNQEKPFSFKDIENAFNIPQIDSNESQSSNARRSELVSVTYTYDNGWLPSDPLIFATSIDDIIIEDGIANISANMICNILTIKPGASLTIDVGVTLTTAAINLESTSQQYSSLISDGTIIGDVTYSRYTAQIGTNDLISAPISGQLFDPFATLNTPNLASSGFIRAFAPYNAIIGAYENYNIVTNATTTIEAGQGFRAATIDGSALIFAGIVRTDDVLDIPISNDGLGKSWNLIGNPYPSYLDFDAFFSLNKSQLDGGPNQAIYGYDGDMSNGWTIWNQAIIDSPAETELIAPGQAFFVKAKSGGGLIDFTTRMRTTGSSDDFILGRESTSAHYGYLELNIHSGDSDFSTDFYFNSNATQGFDPGYDAAMYNENAPDFSIYSNLVENNTGMPLAVQAFSPDAMNTVVVPLGVNADQGQVLTFSILNTDLSSDINVYLEDTLNNSFTLLNTTDYLLTTNTDLSGTGRFYLRFEGEGLSTLKSTLSDINIFANDNAKTIVIEGQLQNDNTAQLHDVNGRLILTHALNSSTNNQTIDVSHLSPGIYILELNNTSNEKRIEKLIIR
tara:strand:- start:9242 stop:11047 length:1806 start_codon:yes stop_codon:yes gene_type:complete